MLIQKLQACPEFIAGDDTQLRELLHPDKLGEMHIDGETQAVEPGDAIYIPPDAKQFIHNPKTEPLIFICIVDPAWRQEDETIY
ncbi:MAG: cupin domain-containing protein [Cyanobacteria bacterium CRU_2_1]|nr:cupin domain-containing protein [Cyanobacteria bacterium RU_5_0]NJR60324.1 cupin domain-containing protein [Cyanobacteria bacterium CRU_2_1]